MLHIPLLRAGRPHRSLLTETLTDVRTGEPVAEVSQAIPGMIARDLRRMPEHQARLAELGTAKLVAICRRAAALFAEAELPVGDGDTSRSPASQSPDDYLQSLAATAGLPIAMGRANLEKIRGVLEGMEEVLAGLTRGLDLRVLDAGWGDQDGLRLSYQRRTDVLGAVLPSNSPGVHNLWLPALPLRIPLALKPGRAEPWTPYRLAQAWIAADGPPEAFSLYPTSHAGANELLKRADRALFFGDERTVAAWRGTGKVSVHGPGWSKVILGPDASPRWADHLDLLAASVAKNGGRSCINASAIWTTSHGRELAEGLAERLATIEARPLDDPDAALAAFPDPLVAHRVSELVDSHLDDSLENGGAVDVTARHRSGARVAEAGGCTFLLPTVVHTRDPEHFLARSELLFPFVTVVEVPPERLWDALGPTLVGTVISDDEVFRRRALAHPRIDRLNLGPVPTPAISWRQPHEGNLFDFVYHQRAFQMATA